jgi:FKBP-type peptidyl-prolyl cis-trans isomerase FkpA
MKLQYFVFLSAGLVVFSLMTMDSSVSAWPLKHGSKNTTQQAYPLGPDAEGFYTSSTGLKFRDLSKGKGQRPRVGQTVVVHYTGWLTNGKKFDSSVDRGEPFEFVLGTGQVIKGWDEGVKGMNIGGKRRLTIPPQLGYGQQGAGNSIPPNATLVFEVELLRVK